MSKNNNRCSNPREGCDGINSYRNRVREQRGNKKTGTFAPVFNIILNWIKSPTTHRRS